MAKKKKFMVMARGEKIQTEGIKTGAGHRSFGEKSVMWISDPAEAREIDSEYGMKGKRQVAVTTDQQYEWSVNNEGGNGTKLNNLHRYTFGQFKGLSRVSFMDKVKRRVLHYGSLGKWIFAFWYSGPSHPDYSSRRIGLRIFGFEIERKIT